MKPKPYKINGNWDAEASVIKVCYGKKFVVMKAKNQISALHTLENTIAAFIRGNEPNPDGMYYHLLLYVKKNPGNQFKVEPLMENIVSKNQVFSGYELLKAEQTALDLFKKDVHCLNNNSNAYIPQYNEETMMYGWFTKGDVLNFKKWYKATHRNRKFAG